MTVHAFMIELDQPDIDIQEEEIFFKNLCTKSMESCSLVASQILVIPLACTMLPVCNAF